jgi:hypothetical protein
LKVSGSVSPKARLLLIAHAVRPMNTRAPAAPKSSPFIARWPTCCGAGRRRNGDGRIFQPVRKGRRVLACDCSAWACNRGWPDFLFFHRSGRCCFLELKRRGSGRMGEAQSAIAAFLIDAGHDFVCTSSFDEAVAVLKQWGVVQARIQVQ